MLKIPIILFVLYLAFGVIELIHPAEDGQSFSGKIRNVGFAAFLLILGGGIVVLIYRVLPVEPRVLQFESIWLSFLILVAYIALMDFFFYWYHRLQHSFHVLFQIHELHHADTEVNATSSLRSYWMERPLQTLLITLPALFIVGIDPVAVIVLPFVTTTWLVFTHANLRLHMGPLTPILCGPQLHRVHHSDQPEHRNKNFAQFLPVYDIIFGTYYEPAKDEFPTTGTPDLAHDESFGRVFKKPFTVWWKTLFRQ